MYNVEASIAALRERAAWIEGHLEPTLFEPDEWAEWRALADNMLAGCPNAFPLAPSIALDPVDPPGDDEARKVALAALRDRMLKVIGDSS